MAYLSIMRDIKILIEEEWNFYEVVLTKRQKAKK